MLKERLLLEYKKIKTQTKPLPNQTLEKFLISGEDHRFRYHLGFDIVAILRAIKNSLIYQKVEGASTIEQQLVRVLTNDFEKKLKRKIKEIFLATTLSELVPRKDIPTIYLYVAYYGAGMQGIDQVFNKLGIDPSQVISNETCAEIIARIKYPESQNNNLRRRYQIEMRKNHLLSLYDKHSSYKQFKIYG
ncbi:MAG: transglycosylase domain-containing protein [Bacteroidia bacterium]|nr:transglycosylase domain-containing protein [Bacteroidia bacterium]